jgi:GYF domain 2
MTNYFIHDGTQKTGPFTLEELKQKVIEQNTMIWFDGLAKWTEAKNVLELNDMVIKSPPPLEKNSQFKETIDKTKKVLETDFVDQLENKISNKTGKTIFKWSIIIFVFLGIIYFTKTIFNSNKISVGRSNVLDSIGLQNQYGSAYFSNYLNKWDVHIQGNMLNKSSVYNYKDFVIEVDFLTETKTLIETKKYTIYQSIKPLDKINFYAELEGEFPEGNKSYSLRWRLLKATEEIPEKDKEN